MQTKPILILYLQCNMIVNVEKAYFIDTLDTFLAKAQNDLMETIQGIMNIEAMQRAQFRGLTWDEEKDKDLQKQIDITKNNLKIQLDNKEYFEGKIAFWNKLKKSKAKIVEVEVDVQL